MYGVLGLSAEERRTIFRNTAQKMGVHEAVVEKDYWVCLILDYLFHKSPFREHLTFKGGTSLSKCFNLIMRFSEDIDLVLDWQVLGYEKDEPWRDRSKTKQDAFNKEANTRTEFYLSNEFLPMFVSELSEIIGEKVETEISQSNPQTVNVHYPQLFRTGSILQSICLEIGALAAWTPVVVQTVTPYIFDYYPGLDRATSTTAVASSVERTFWEKATILHHEANRPEHLDMPMRYSRHYYDLNCIAQTKYKAKALQQLDLLQKVRDFKRRFYPRTWAKYEEAVPGSIRLIPPYFRIEALRNDYKGMEEMFFGEYPSFDKLMESLKNLENEVNKL